MGYTEFKAILQDRITAPVTHRCSAILSEQPEWMNPDQWSPCQCDAVDGHGGSHTCEHLRQDTSLCPKGLTIGPIVKGHQTFHGPLGFVPNDWFWRGYADDEFGLQVREDTVEAKTYIVQCHPPAPTKNMKWWEALENRHIVVPDKGRPFIATIATLTTIDGDERLSLTRNELSQLVRLDGTVTVERETTKSELMQ
jgi:hypothetical protein